MDGNTRFSTLDHFIWSKSLDDFVTDAGVLHSIDNMSDHSPIYCCLNLEMTYKLEEAKPPSQPKVKWNLASVDEKNIFKLKLDEELSLLDIPMSVIQCRDVQCTLETHRDEADSFMISILNSVENAAFKSLPYPMLKCRAPN